MFRKKKLFLILILFFISVILAGCENRELGVGNSKSLTLEEQLIEMENEIENYKEQITTLAEESKQQADNNRKRYLYQMDELRKEINDLEKENKELNDKINGLNTELYYGNDRIIQLNKYITMLENHKNQMENIIEPKYILNVFDPLEVEKGDIIAGLTIEEKHVGIFENIDVCVYNDIEFNGKYELKGKIYKNEDFDGVEILIDKSQFTHIPLHINYMDMDSMYITILNGNELINSLGDQYFDGIEIIALYSGLRYHGKIEADKMIDTTFIELIAIN